MTMVHAHQASVSDKTDETAKGESILCAVDLTKRASEHTLVSHVSLSLKRGEVLGLLGLNGAGKSTTLKMLCGMLAPDEGSVMINGYSMSESPLMARAQIGFLPDQPPVYNDLRVVEYLKLCGQIRGLKTQTLRQRQSVALELCQLGDVQTKLIGSLSKGFRQRVGLAQAIIHEPAVVLLDEPGNGLDPQQQDNMRELIRSLGEHQAVVFSTHLLAEAKSTCDRIAILHKGILVADHLKPNDDLDAQFRSATE